jgi:catechol 2,3-dioxygenase-like lactoylglutathione lyase family enzyme
MTAKKSAAARATKPPKRQAPAPKRKAPATRAAAPKAAKRAASTKAAKQPAPARSAATKRPAATPTAAARREITALPGAVDFPSAIGAITQHLDFTTHDPDALRRFYGELLGLKAQSDGAPGSFRVRLNAGASVAFRPPAPGPPEQWRPPREPVMVFVVGDADRAYEMLKAKGVSFDKPPADLSWGARGALVRDPEGRMVWIVHPLQEAS